MERKGTGRNSNGSGSFYYDEKRGKWFAEIQWKDRQGNKHRKKFSADKKNKVKNKLDEFKKQLMLSEGNLKRNEVSFKEFSEYWLNSVLKNKLKPTSFARKEVTLLNQVYPYLGNIPIDQITHNDVQAMVNDLSKKNLSYSTIKKAYEAVNGCIKEYRIRTATPFNPCEGISLPINNRKDTSSIVFFNNKQRELIRAEATRKYGTGKPVYRLGNAIVTLMYTGMRIGEFIALKWEDINFEEKTIRINKNAVVIKGDGNAYTVTNQTSTKTYSSTRTIPMTEVAFASLKEIFKITGDMDYVLSTANNKQINPRNINRMFHSILKQTGIAKTPQDYCGVHTLRHTFASMLFSNGCDVKIVSEILGHSDTKITENIYIHIIHSQKIKAIQDIDKYSD